MAEINHLYFSNFQLFRYIVTDNGLATLSARCNVKKSNIVYECKLNIIKRKTFLFLFRDVHCIRGHSTFNYTCLTSHWRSSHYAVTHMRNKDRQIQERSPNVAKVISMP